MISPRVFAPPALAVRSQQSSSSITWLHPKSLQANPFSLAVYGDPALQVDDLPASVREHGILVPLVVTPAQTPGAWMILSGHRRWACALSLSLTRVPCEVRAVEPEASCRRIVLEYNRQRQKSFSQLMREADALEELLKEDAKCRSLANLRSRSGVSRSVERRNSATQDQGSGGERRERLDYRGRTDSAVAHQIGFGGKDRYRQARAIWRKACGQDVRAQASVALLDAGLKTVHSAYKDLRRRVRFTADFRPTPYDVWAFRHDDAFGVPHPGSTPAGIIAHLLHYFTPVNGLVVDPMAGGGAIIDVCESMSRRCLAYDLAPTRPDIQPHDVRGGFSPEASGCDLIFCDPPYYTMLASSYDPDSVSSVPLGEWTGFLRDLARHAFTTLAPNGYLALLLAPQTEKDLPSGYGYLDHTFLAYQAGMHAGFLPERRISCPMSGGYRPQQVSRARTDGRLLGQVRDLLILRKPGTPALSPSHGISALHEKDSP